VTLLCDGCPGISLLDCGEDDLAAQATSVQFRSSAKTNMLPKIELPGKPQYRKLLDDFSFFDIFKRIERHYDTCFLLESLGEESRTSRYFIIGFDPVWTLSATDQKTLNIQNNRDGSSESHTCDNPYFALRDIVPTNAISRRYAGGIMGYLGYDCVNFFEPRLQCKTSELFEPFKFGVYLDGLVYDQTTGETFYYFYDEDRYAEIESVVRQEWTGFGDLSCHYLGDSMSREQHEELVNRAKQYIANGRIFQCEVGFKSNYEINGDTLQIYSLLRDTNPSPHMFYLKFDTQRIVGASPELLFRMRNGELESFPLAGTTRRGGSALEDVQLARALLNDPKEIAEHNMLVDLHRNDIGKVAKFGTVKVRSLMDIKRYSHVQHISSEIVGIVDDNEDMFSALAAGFPAGTLSGAPKVEAMKIINEFEPDGRGPYGGGVGQFSFNGDCTFAIPIRTLFINGEQAYIQTCGGNVYDSVAADEYLEIERKLAAMRSVLNRFEK